MRSNTPPKLTPGTEIDHNYGQRTDQPLLTVVKFFTSNGVNIYI